MRAVAISLLLLLACAVPAVGATWERAEYPAVSGRAQVFRAAAAFGEEGVWAAGYTYGTIGGALEFRTLIQRWDGSSWSQVPTPDRETAPARNLLFDVTATGPDSAWAVGHSATAPGNGASRPLVLNWDGVAWSIVDDPPGSFGMGLVSVAAAADGTVLIAGSGRNPYSGYAVPVVWRRVAGGWQSIPFPTISGCHVSPNGLATRAELSDVVSQGLRATWAAGRCVTPDGNERGFLVRYNGSRWFTVLSPDALAKHGEDGALSGVAMSPERDVWAVGWASGAASWEPTPLTFRGKGGHVKSVATPVQGPWGSLQAVAVGQGGAAVAAGSQGRPGSNAPYPFLLGAGGAGWLLEPADASLVGNLYGVALQPSGTAWAVGVSSWDDYGLILRRTP